jgi:hypothetical protein
VRAFDIALAAFALRASPAQPPKHERRLVPLIDDANADHLDRAKVTHERAALIVSLWPPARQCVVTPIYAALPAPAQFGACFRVSWPPWPTADARSLQARLAEAFPRVR